MDIEKPNQETQECVEKTSEEWTKWFKKNEARTKNFIYKEVLYLQDNGDLSLPIETIINEFHHTTDLSRKNELLISIGHYSGNIEQEYRLVCDTVLTNITDKNKHTRFSAILSLSHIARIQRQLPMKDTVMAILHAIVDPDESIHDVTDNTIADLEVFTPELGTELRELFNDFEIQCK